MAEKHEKKTQDQYKKKVIDFMNKRRYKDDMNEKHTHSSWGNIIQGKFYIDNNDMKEFINLYCDAIDNNVNDFSILETQDEYSPIIVDIDLKYPSENHNPKKRIYDSNLIFNIFNKYITVIEKYLEIDYSKIMICIFEKNNATKLDDTYKDGFHIIFPNVCSHTKMRHLIRHNVVKLCEEDGTFETFLDGPDKIIDKAVVSSNGWFLYGSKKPGYQPYKLSKTYNNNLEEIIIEGNLIKFFSLRNKKKKYSEKTAAILKKEYVDSDINAEINKLGININQKNIDTKYEISEAKEDLIKKACILVNMLGSERSKNYEDWRNVGLSLHNIDISLLPTWIEFSRKCTDKFKEGDGQGDCYKFWNQFKIPSAGNLLTIRSLAYWAKIDNPKEYELFINDEFKKKREDSIDGSTWKIAKSFYAKYSDRFVCSSARSNEWWEYKNHKWQRIEDAYTIKILLSEEFQNDYRNDIIDMTIRATKISGFEKEQLQSRISATNKIIERLMNIDFKKKIIEEAKSLFLDPKFNEILDSNPYLLGCENGVYDIRQRMFRNGHPDDFVSINTKVNYKKYSDKMPYIKNIQIFLDQILPNVDIKEYLMLAISTCVSGENKEEKLYILTGSGSNGKSVLMELVSKALGDYYMSCPITIITRKRGSSNETSPEKVRMKGKRCGVFQETDDGDKINVGIMKEFTGGDEVLVRDLFKGSNEMIQYKPQIKCFMTCNQLPAIPSNDDGTWRRLRVIEFSSKFVDNPTKSNEFKINTNLKQDITNWASTFLSYLVHIYETKYRDINYLKEPTEVMASTTQYKMENDFYTEYIMDRIERTTSIKNTISRENLYKDFKEWYKTNYEGRPVPKKPEFERIINKIIGEPSRKGYVKVIFNTLIESDNESVQTNILDM
jgi:P4 family phage/plasmid primase-like protien